MPWCQLLVFEYDLDLTYPWDWGHALHPKLSDFGLWHNTLTPIFSLTCAGGFRLSAILAVTPKKRKNSPYEDAPIFFSSLCLPIRTMQKGSALSLLDVIDEVGPGWAGGLVYALGFFSLNSSLFHLLSGPKFNIQALSNAGRAWVGLANEYPLGGARL